ncbi:MAG: hypothetical protein PHY48_00660 [Candidatus Cloacimonetes bacterium]|nr:hypothetical protein [Candidatus Cloacimonadota bacterium]
MCKVFVSHCRKHRLLSISLLLLLLISMFACGGNHRPAPMDIDSFNLVSSISAGMPLQKAVYYPANQNLYAMSRRTQEISIFEGTVRKNVVGGLGTGTSNFQALSDIAVGFDGSLLALDSVSKSIKMFNTSGKAKGTLELKGSIQPTLIAVNSNQSFYIYDAASAEIILYSALDGTEQFRFGKFELNQVTQLSCNRDYVVAYDDTEDESHIFSSLGQFIKSETGQTLFDDYNNGLNLAAGMLISQMSHASLSIGEGSGLMNINRDIVVLVFEEEIRVLKIGYKQVR